MIFIFLCALILFITIYLRINLKIEYDVLSNNGYIKLTLFKYIYLISSEFKINGDFIEIKKKNKEIKINLKITKKQMRFLKELNKNLLSKIYFNEINLKSIISLKNPCYVSIFSGLYSILTSIFLIKFKFENYDCNVVSGVETGFCENVLKININSTIYTSIFDLIWAFIVTLIIDRRKNNEERRSKTKC